MISIDELNQSQRRAARWGEGPLLVLAGPGSGKTSVLTLRIAEVIKQSPDEKFRILGLTFTVRAATEMQDRLRALLGENSRRIQLRTFHSFCTDLLRQHGSHVGLKPDFSVITDDKDRVAILKDLGEQLAEVGYIVDEPERALKQIDTIFTNGIGVNELPGYFDQNAQNQCEELQAVLSAYLGTLTASNQLDFGAMLYFARELLATKPRIQRQVKTVYRYVCVDEFQDTNIAQYRVLKLLAEGPEANIFVVADDDQVIFQWNGADPKRLEEFKRDFSPVVIQLPDNYRCPEEVVEIANRLISHNSDRTTDKSPSVSRSHSPGIVTVEAYDTLDDEVAGLADRLKDVSSGRRSNCLVIARSNKLLLEAKNLLAEHSIEAEVVVKSQEFSSPLMKLMYLSLKLANTPDSRSILNKLCVAASDASGDTISAEEIASQAQVSEQTYLRSFFADVAERRDLKAFSETGLRNLCEEINYEKFVEVAMKELEALNTNDEFPDFPMDSDNWKRITGEIARQHGSRLSLHVLLQEMDLAPKSKRLPRTCVRMQTVHTAKGVEFTHVFLIGLAEDQFPTYFAKKSGDTGRAMEEERRNCFVAITRASKSLYLSYAGEYNGWPKRPSRFLREMGLLDG